MCQANTPPKSASSTLRPTPMSCFPQKKLVVCNIWRVVNANFRCSVNQVLAGAGNEGASWLA